MAVVDMTMLCLGKNVVDILSTRKAVEWHKQTNKNVGGNLLKGAWKTVEKIAILKFAWGLAHEFS